MHNKNNEYCLAPGHSACDELIDSHGNFVSLWSAMLIAVDPTTMQYKLFPMLARRDIDKSTVLHVLTKQASAF